MIHPPDFLLFRIWSMLELNVTKCHTSCTAWPVANKVIWSVGLPSTLPGCVRQGYWKLQLKLNSTFRKREEKCDREKCKRGHSAVKSYNLTKQKDSYWKTIQCYGMCGLCAHLHSELKALFFYLLFVGLKRSCQTAEMLVNHTIKQANTGFPPT